MQMTPRPRSSSGSVSVVIPAYNAEGFVHRAIGSVLGQSISVLEVLIVDDASTDGTVIVVEQLALADSRIRLLTLPTNSGPSVARNVGLAAAMGDWIAVLDADDAYLPERIERMLQAAVESDADILVDNFRYFNPSTGTVGEPVLDEHPELETVTLEHYLTKARPLTGEPDWGLLKPMFRKSFIDKKGLQYPTYSRHGEDFLFMVEALLQGARYVLMRGAGYLYTGRESGFSRTSISYPLMLRHTENLMIDPRIAANAVLIDRLRGRALALRKYSAAHDLAHFRRERDYLSIAFRVLSDSSFRSMLGSKLIGKLGRPARRLARSR
jgi:succinoglycan biosynthesis protein ExoO